MGIFFGLSPSLSTYTCNQGRVLFRKILLLSHLDQALQGQANKECLSRLFFQRLFQIWSMWRSKEST